MSVSMIGPKFYAWDTEGSPLAFGKLYTYKARTNAPKATFQSEDALVENTNPVILNGEGYANIYLDGSYKVVLKDSDDNEIWSADPVTASSAEEWVNSFSVDYLSSNEVKVQGNVTGKYSTGRQVRLTNDIDYFYNTITGSSFGGGETTIELAQNNVPVSVTAISASIGELSQNSHAITLQDAIATPWREGQTVVTSGYYVNGDGGGANYIVVAGGTGTPDGGSYIDLANGLQLHLHTERLYIEQYGAVAYDMEDSVWPSNGLGFVDSTIAMNAALATGRNVYTASTLSSATYRLTDEVLVNSEAQKLIGNGAGELQLNFFALKQGTAWNTRFLFHGTPTKYTKTRRQNRLTSGDAQDAATACGINVQAAYARVQGILVDLEVDYTDTSQFNLGADYDHGVMVGTRVGVHLIDVHVRGYFRVAAIYLDNTRLGPDYPFVTPGNITYSADTGVNNGTDKFRGENLVTAGGHKGLFIAGPIDGRPLNYYDEIAGGLVPDSRGGFGTSDYLITQSFFGGPDHHSGYRRTDPPLNDGLTRIDPAKVDIDAAAGSYFYDSLPSRQSRRVKFDTCRFTTIEAVRIFIGNGLEMIFDNPVTESLSGTVMDTGGTVINQYDYTLQSFKDIACYATEYDGADTGARRISFLQSGGNPNTNYFQGLVTEHYVTIVGNDPMGAGAKEYDCGFLFANITGDITTYVKDLSPLFNIQVIAEWTGLDDSDDSVVNIAVTSGSMKVGDNGVLRVDAALSTGLVYVDEGAGPYTLSDTYELRVDGQSSSSTRFNLYKNGIKQRYSDGILTSGRLVAVGLTSDTYI